MPDDGASARLLTPTDVRELAGRLGVRPSKRLGQNFVIESGTVRRIAALAALRPDDVVLEVGPGLGSLTLALLEAGAGQLVAVEIDQALAGELPRTIAARAPHLADQVVVVTADALKIGALPAAPTVLVANLPYNVAVPVLLHLLAVLPSLTRGLVMVQAEVADRMCAGPGSRVYGTPSVKLAWYAAARAAGTVPRTVFWPVPNVDSRLVAFTRHDPPATTASRAEVVAVIDAAFRPRRKTLRAARRASIRVCGERRSAWPSSRGWRRCIRSYRVRFGHRDRCDSAGTRQTQPPARSGSAAARRLSRPGDRFPCRVAVRRGHGRAGRTGRGRGQR